MDERLLAIAAAQPYPLAFATLSGAHLYGFDSPDSDFDIRGVHVLPLAELLGLATGPETVEAAELAGGLELDLVTHELRKFCLLMLKKNGYVLEQLYSPLVVATSPLHEELKAIGARCLTRHHWHHYAGFAQTQWKLFNKEQPRRAKPLLYVIRILLAGIHLMRTGEIEANLPRLNQHFGLGYVPDLIERKRLGPEHGALGEADLAFFEAEVARLHAELEQAASRTALPDEAAGRADLHELLVRARLAGA